MPYEALLRSYSILSYWNLTNVPLDNKSNFPHI